MLASLLSRGRFSRVMALPAGFTPGDLHQLVRLQRRKPLQIRTIAPVNRNTASLGGNVAANGFAGHGSATTCDLGQDNGSNPLLAVSSIRAGEFMRGVFPSCPGTSRSKHSVPEPRGQ
jgi:hypothetical protein